MKLYYEARTNIKNCVITDIVFTSSSLSLELDDIILSAHSAEGYTKDEIASGRWKGFDVDNITPDNHVHALVTALSSRIVENISITGDLPDEQKGYVRLTKLELAGNDDENYVFPTSHINRTIEFESD